MKKNSIKLFETFYYACPKIVSEKFLKSEFSKVLLRDALLTGGCLFCRQKGKKAKKSPQSSLNKVPLSKIRLRQCFLKINDFVTHVSDLT